MSTAAQAFTRTVSISPRGVLVLPEAARQALGIAGKGYVGAEVRADGVVLRRAADGGDALRVSRSGVVVLPPTALGGGWISSGKIAYSVFDDAVLLHPKE
ncbi:MAG: hypothetical protein JWM87_3368 [Candidatus Eremiobacteraeota bacterium]|nr:hypothetical protein [Candidatus Eremiobacteraeota bacterium]